MSEVRRQKGSWRRPALRRGLPTPRGRAVSNDSRFIVYDSRIRSLNSETFVPCPSRRLSPLTAVAIHRAMSLSIVNFSPQSKFPPVRTSPAFTLIEIVIAIFVLMLMLLLAVPSFTGVLADRRLRRSLDSFNNLVHEAQGRSLAEHRAYLIFWGTKSIGLRPEALVKGDDPNPVAQFAIGAGETMKLVLPAALAKNPPAEWIFWPTGTCEPAEVQFTGHDGAWSANYSALTAQPTLTNYAAR